MLHSPLRQVAVCYGLFVCALFCLRLLCSAMCCFGVVHLLGLVLVCFNLACFAVVLFVCFALRCLFCFAVP